MLGEQWSKSDEVEEEMRVQPLLHMQAFPPTKGRPQIRPQSLFEMRLEVAFSFRDKGYILEWWFMLPLWNNHLSNWELPNISCAWGFEVHILLRRP